MLMLQNLFLWLNIVPLFWSGKINAYPWLNGRALVLHARHLGLILMQTEMEHLLCYLIKNFLVWQSSLIAVPSREIVYQLLVNCGSLPRCWTNSPAMTERLLKQDVKLENKKNTWD